MRRERYEHKGHIYWVVVEPIYDKTTGVQQGFIAYLNDEEPGGLLYGKIARDHNGQVILFGDVHSALTNANAIKRAEIDSRP